MISIAFRSARLARLPAVRGLASAAQSPAAAQYRANANEKLLKHLNKYENFVTSCTVNLKVEQRGGGLHDTAHKGLEAHVAELEKNYYNI